jgi:hypothetical protein
MSANPAEQVIPPLTSIVPDIESEGAAEAAAQQREA